MSTPIDELLREMQINPEAYDADGLIDLFLSEMKCGLTGAKSSLAMIPSHVGIAGSVPQDEPVIVIDAGGTNLRVCLVSFDESGAPQISAFTQVAMPGTQGELTADEFYVQLTDLIEPLADQSARIGFCFSYPAEIQPDLDGVLLRWTKEVRVPELVGQRLAKGLSLELGNRELGEKKIVILNDTVACLLAGRAQGAKWGCESFIGFILGTGTNTAYVEQNAHIQKLAELNPSASQVINVESGGFGRCPRGALDVELDQQSENPGGHIFEKMISGVYLGKLALVLSQAAAERGLFSDAAARDVLARKELPWIEANRFLHDSMNSGFADYSAADHQLLRGLLMAMIDRAALLTAVNISAAAIKSGKGRSAEAPICINIDGSTYYKTHQLAEKVQAHLAEILGARGIHYRCVQVDDAPIIGAAIAGLTAF